MKRPMSLIEIQGIAERYVQACLAQRGGEDSLVEFKREWPEPSKFARQFAGLANAARGERILLIVGFDDKERKFFSFTSRNVLEWWSQMVPKFIDKPPHMIGDLLVNVDGQSVHAVAFDTSEGPYLVSVGPNSQQLEVPWRTATGTRSANKGDLLSLLYSRRRFSSEIVNCQVNHTVRTPTNFSRQLEIRFYVFIDGDGPLYFPQHRRRESISLELPGTPPKTVSYRPNYYLSIDGNPADSQNIKLSHPCYGTVSYHLEIDMTISSGTLAWEFENTSADGSTVWRMMHRVSLPKPP